MNASFAFPNTRLEELRRFSAILFMFAAAALLLVLPDAAFAQGFDGRFGPDQNLVQNTDASLLAWWKAIAAWGMWVAVAGFLVSILFFGGKWWWVPLAFFVVCLFGEPAITQVRSWAGMGTAGG